MSRLLWYWLFYRSSAWSSIAGSKIEDSQTIGVGTWQWCWHRRYWILARVDSIMLRTRCEDALCSGVGNDSGTINAKLCSSPFENGHAKMGEAFRKRVVSRGFEQLPSGSLLPELRSERGDVVQRIKDKKNGLRMVCSYHYLKLSQSPM